MHHPNAFTHTAPLVRILAGAAAALALASACSSGSSPSDNAPKAGSNGGGAATAPAAPAEIDTTSGALGTFLTDSSGRTLYLWEADKSTDSTCYGQCESFWPPVLTKGAPTAGSGADASKLGTTTRKDGTMQVTYAGHPLYYYAEDGNAGDVNGQGNDGFGALWWVVDTAGSAITGSAMPSPSGGGGGYNY